MAKEEMYHIALDDYEHGIIIRSLNDEKTDLMNEGKYRVSDKNIDGYKHLGRLVLTLRNYEV